METFEVGLERHPKNVDLRFNLGAAYDKLGRFPDVVREMEAVMELNPDHSDALNYLGYSYADRGVNIEQAVALTQRAVALKPNNGYYFDSLGWALFKIGRVQDALVERIKKYIPEPVITVSVPSVAGNKIYVIGQVNRPGEFLATHRIDVMQALSLAGGLTPFADEDDIKVLRRENGKQLALPFDYSEVKKGKSLDLNVVLKSGDIVVVPD